MTSDLQFGMGDILAILPHRPPFLFVDRIIRIVPDTMIITEKDIRAEEFYFAGHFPQKPIMPGVIVTDALAQTSGLLWGLTKRIKDASSTEEPPEVFYLASVNMKYTHPAYPGDTLRMTAHAERVFGTLHSYQVEACCGRDLIAKGSLTLAMKETLA